MKVKILTGTYILQANRASFNQYAVDPTCKVCQGEPEDRVHFIARCKSLDHVRDDIHTTSTGSFCIDTRLFE